jgi:hypothetical protein
MDRAFSELDSDSRRAVSSLSRAIDILVELWLSPAAQNERSDHFIQHLRSKRASELSLIERSILSSAGIATSTTHEDEASVGKALWPLMLGLLHFIEWGFSESLYPVDSVSIRGILLHVTVTEPWSQVFELGRYTCELAEICSVPGTNYSSLQHVISWIRSILDSQALPSSPLLTVVETRLRDAERAVFPSTGQAMGEIWKAFLLPTPLQRPDLVEASLQIQGLLRGGLPRGLYLLSLLLLMSDNLCHP